MLKTHTFLSSYSNIYDESALANKIIGNVQQNQRDALIVTSISLVCAIVLYGRATGGVCLGNAAIYMCLCACLYV